MQYNKLQEVLNLSISLIKYWQRAVH